MIHHLVTGAAAAQSIAVASAEIPGMAGKVWSLEEQLHVGPIARAMNESFDETRAAWWQTILPAEKTPPAGAQDLLLKLGNTLNKEPQAVVWIWMAPHAADISAYYFALSRLEKHRGRVFLIQIAGLPFLDENQKIFFPKSFAGLSVRELGKCQKLVRPVTPSELELDLDFWKELSQLPAGIRVQEGTGGKKLLHKDYDFYDSALMQLATNSFQKAQRMVQHAIQKTDLQVPDFFLGWRLKTLAGAGQLLLQGDAGKSLRDFELKLPVPETTAS